MVKWSIHQEVIITIKVFVPINNRSSKLETSDRTKGLNRWRYNTLSSVIGRINRQKAECIKKI